MRFRTTILLLGLNIGLLLVLYYLQHTQSTTELFDENNRLVLDPTFIESIDTIQITNSQAQSTWTLTKEEDRWIVEEPQEWKANPYAIQRIIHLLQSLKWETRFSLEDLEEAGQPLSNYGLVEPDTVLSLSSSSGESRVIPIGSPTKVGNRIYAKSPDENYVYVLNRDLLEGVSRDLEAFYDRAVFSLNADETRAIQIQDRSAGNVRVRVVRTPDGWKLTSPIETPAAKEEVLGLLLDLASLEAASFVQPDSVNANFESPSLRLVLEGFNRRESLLIANSPDEGNGIRVYAKREAYPTVFELSSRTSEMLRNAQESLREKRILYRPDSSWNALEVRMEGQSTTIQQLENGNWQVVTTDDVGNLQTLPAENSIIEDLKSTLRNLRAVQFATDAPSESDLVRFGLNDPQRIIIARTEEKPDLEVTIGNKVTEDTLLYATTNLAPTVYLITPFILSRLPLDPLYYRERTMSQLADSAIISEIRFIPLNESGEPLPAPNEAILEQTKQYLKNARVSRYIASSFENPLNWGPNPGLSWAYRIDLDYRLPGSNDDKVSTKSFFITRPLGGTTQFIGSPTEGLIGVLPAEMIELLTPLFRLPEPVTEGEDEPQP